MTKTTLKYAKTIKDYEVNIFGHKFTIPAGSHVSNTTAFGPDDNYRHWRLWSNVVESVTGTKNSILAHDIEHRGINIPAEYCEPWPTKEKFVIPDTNIMASYNKLTLKEITEAPYELEVAEKEVERLKEAFQELHRKIWGKDIPNPTTPEYREWHENCQDFMRFIRETLFPDEQTNSSESKVG